MDRAEAEAVYDSGREACVEFILGFAARVELHEERLRRLEEQARQDSRTSSKPPSQDPPKTRQQRRAEARLKAKELFGEGRKAGGQEGHRGAGRELTPEDQIDEIVDHYPGACRGCGREFTEQERRPASRFGRHQVAELPPITVLFVEHRTHRLCCPECQLKTTARLPGEVRGSAFGPRLQAAVVTLTARDRISRRGIVELARDLFGAGVSVGAVDAICQRTSAALAGPHAQLQNWVLDQGAVHVDETGWRTAGESRALWTATTPAATLLQIAEHCNREQFDQLIGDYTGIVISDRWNGYSHLDPERRQVCWSHIQRDFRRHSEGLAEQKTFGQQGLELTRQVFTAWHRYQHEHHDRDQLQAQIAPIQTQLRQLLQAASPKSRRTRWHRRFANNLLKVWPALWTFTSVEGVEPTNNPAERALRSPVIHRKLSHGTRSTNGERFTERALSAAATCRLQHRSLFAYLSELIVAHNRGDPLPALP
ncbi:MAG TPA: IS66 family transposase [Solirubrobacteraceae bacterium]|nr:IS66 family transposase [Solirubrobacteraceae bacterium]